MDSPAILGRAADTREIRVDLSGVGKTDQRCVGNQLHLQGEPGLSPVLALLAEGGRPVGGRDQRPRLPRPPRPPSSTVDLLTRSYQVRQPADPRHRSPSCPQAPVRSDPRPGVHDEGPMRHGSRYPRRDEGVAGSPPGWTSPRPRLRARFRPARLNPRPAFPWGAARLGGTTRPPPRRYLIEDGRAPGR